MHPPFEKGHPPYSKGRPLGSRTKLCKRLLEDLFADWQEGVRLQSK
jgi:hypothetical protein